MASYYKTCDTCGSRIRMAQLAGGHYRAFEPGFIQGRHSCRSRYSAMRVHASAIVKTLAEPLAQLPDENRCDVHVYPISGFDPVARFILLIRIVFILIVAATWLFLTQLLHWWSDGLPVAGQ